MSETPTAWRDVAAHLHGVLAAAGVTVPLCGPGTPADCGGSWAHHALSYAVMLQAWAENRIEHIEHGDGDIRALADQMLDHWRATFRHDYAHERTEQP